MHGVAVMDNIWFKRWGIFIYIPVNAKGWLTIIVTVFASIPFGSIAVLSTNDAISLVSGVVAISIIFIGHIVVFNHLDRRYSREGT